MRTPLTAIVHPPTPSVSNSNLGLWIGITYLVIACLAWIPLDWWLHRTGRPYITSCVRRLLESGSWGAVVGVCFLGAILALFLYHMFYERAL